MATKKKKKTFSFWKRILKFLFYLFLLNLIYIVLTRWVDPPLTSVMIHSKIKGYGWDKKTMRWDDMGYEIKLAAIAGEDQRFLNHYGFDTDAIGKAIKHNKNPKAKKIYGASTITQQTAKNVFLWNGRSWIRKGLEVYHAVMIELIWGKKRILENYLNVAEMGKGIFGVEAAAQFYFNKRAKNLTANEASWIISILPSPKKLDIKKPNRALSKRHQWILTQMNNLRSDKQIVDFLKK
ncbi:MAG: monofunctional biosynthetic peptidoglycan transglycosylase [Chitinophagaceae bacterium]